MSPQANQPHVAVVAFPFGTHAAPLLAAVRYLAAASPAATFSFFGTPESNKSVFAGAGGCGGVRAYDVWNGVPEGHVFSGEAQEPIELFMKAAPASVRLSVAAAEADAGRAVTCLVTDAFFWFAAEMAEEMDVPWVAFWTAGPASLSTHLYTDLIRQTIDVTTATNIQEDDDQYLSFIPGMAKVLVADLPEGVVFGNLDSLFSTMLHKMGLNLPRAAAVFINSFQELDTTITNDLASKFSKFLSVGPLNLASLPPEPARDQTGCLAWLDSHEPASAVYVSFGSVTVPPEAELAALAEALEGSGVPFVWSLKDEGKLPRGFRERTGKQGLVVTWAPQAEILSRAAVGAFVTHCGWNSVLESVAGGVPMICRPFFGDQRLNGRMVQDVWGIGVGVGGGVLTKEGVETCLDLLLRREEGKRMREKIGSLRELAVEAVGPGGSSTQNFRLLRDVIIKPK